MATTHGAAASEPDGLTWADLADFVDHVRAAMPGDIPPDAIVRVRVKASMKGGKLTEIKLSSGDRKGTKA